MVQASEIRARMEVLGADGVHVGRVEAVEGSWIRLADEKQGEAGYRQLPLSAVGRVDGAVHLAQDGAAARAMLGAPVAGTAPARSGSPPVRDRDVTDPRSRATRYLPWIVGIVALLLLLGLVRACTHRSPPPPPGPPAPAIAASDNVPVLTTRLPPQRVALPDGTSMMLRPDTLDYALQRYLASNQPAPRTFGVDVIGFAPDTVTPQPENAPALDRLAQVLRAYPHAVVLIVGYADPRPGSPPDDRLAADRAAAIAAALGSRGVDRGRVQTAAAGQTHRTDAGRAGASSRDNRRIELVVKAK